MNAAVFFRRGLFFFCSNIINARFAIQQGHIHIFSHKSFLAKKCVFYLWQLVVLLLPMELIPRHCQYKARASNFSQLHPAYLSLFQQFVLFPKIRSNSVANFLQIFVCPKFRICNPYAFISILAYRRDAYWSFRS